MSEIDRTDAAQLAAKMSNTLTEQGCVPLFLVGGKEIGGGYRTYAVAGDIDRDHIIYILKRLIKLIDGTVSKEIESN